MIPLTEQRLNQIGETPVPVLELTPIEEGQLYYELTVPHDFPAGSVLRFGYRGGNEFVKRMDIPIQAGTVIRFPAEGDPFISITSPT